MNPALKTVREMQKVFLESYLVKNATQAAALETTNIHAPTLGIWLKDDAFKTIYDQKNSPVSLTERRDMLNDSLFGKFFALRASSPDEAFACSQKAYSPKASLEDWKSDRMARLKILYAQTPHDDEHQHMREAILLSAISLRMFKKMTQVFDHMGAADARHWNHGYDPGHYRPAFSKAITSVIQRENWAEKSPYADAIKDINSRLDAIELPTTVKQQAKPVLVQAPSRPAPAEPSTQTQITPVHDRLPDLRAMYDGLRGQGGTDIRYLRQAIFLTVFESEGEGNFEKTASKLNVALSTFNPWVAPSQGGTFTPPLHAIRNTLKTPEGRSEWRKLAIYQDAIAMLDEALGSSARLGPLPEHAVAATVKKRTRALPPPNPPDETSAITPSPAAAEHQDKAPISASPPEAPEESRIIIPTEDEINRTLAMRRLLGEETDREWRRLARIRNGNEFNR